MNVLDSMAKSVHRRAKAAIHEITQAENKAEARKAIKAFASELGVRWPKAAAKIEEDEEGLLEAAEGRRPNVPHLVAFVRAGAEFVNGELVERSEEKDAA